MPPVFFARVLCSSVIARKPRLSGHNRCEESDLKLEPIPVLADLARRLSVYCVPREVLLKS